MALARAEAAPAIGAGAVERQLPLTFTGAYLTGREFLFPKITTAVARLYSPEDTSDYVSGLRHEIACVMAVGMVAERIGQQIREKIYIDPAYNNTACGQESLITEGTTKWLAQIFGGDSNVVKEVVAQNLGEFIMIQGGKGAMWGLSNSKEEMTESVGMEGLRTVLAIANGDKRWQVEESEVVFREIEALINRVVTDTSQISDSWKTIDEIADRLKPSLFGQSFASVKPLSKYAQLVAELNQRSPHQLTDIRLALTEGMEEVFVKSGWEKIWEVLTSEAKEALVFLGVHNGDNLSLKTRMFLDNPFLRRVLSVLPSNVQKKFSDWHAAACLANSIARVAGEYAYLQIGWREKLVQKKLEAGRMFEEPWEGVSTAPLVEEFDRQKGIRLFLSGLTLFTLFAPNFLGKHKNTSPGGTNGGWDIFPGFKFFHAPTNTITVNSLLQSPGNPGDCTLGEAIQAANTDAAVDGCNAGNGPDTIVLPGYTYLLTQPDNISANGPNGLPVVTSEIIIEGNRATITRDLNDPDFFRLVEVDTGGDLMVNNVTFQGGKQDSVYYRGGCIYNGGNLIIDGGRVYQCSSRQNGGGIYNDGPGADLTLRGGSEVAYNSSGWGGGINNVEGRVTVSDSAIFGNAAGLGGGFASHGEWTMRNTSVTGNNSDLDGGGGFAAGPMYIEGSTFNDNISNYNRSYPDRRAGGLDYVGGYNGNAASGEIVNSTFSGNRSLGSLDEGGGLFVAFALPADSLRISYTTFSGNQAPRGANFFFEASPNGGNPNGEVVFEATIMNDPVNGPNCGGDLSTSAGYNLETGNSCGFTGVGDQQNVDPLLGLLGNNGGTTLTHALLPGSPAIDAGGDIFPPTDQRGVPRTDGKPDSGSFEYGGIIPPTVTNTTPPTSTLTSTPPPPDTNTPPPPDTSTPPTI